MEENNGYTVTIGVKRKIIEENHIPTFTHFEKEDSDGTENDDPKINKEIPDGSDSDDNEEIPDGSDSDNEENPNDSDDNEEIPDKSDSEENKPENSNDSDDEIDTRKKDGIRPIHVLFIFLAYFIFLMNFNILRYYGYESVPEFIKSTLTLGNNTMSLCRDL
jgi:hypothetical protein